MQRQLIKKSLKLRLLAFVLAVALVCYSINPSPKPSTRIKREEELPDKKKREAGPLLLRAAIKTMFLATSVTKLEIAATPNEDEDDFDWPEYIDA